MNSDKLSFLIVEDDIYYSHQIKKIVEQYGSVDIANYEEMAIGFINKNHYDLAFIDLNLNENEPQTAQGLNVLKRSVEKKIYSIILSNNDDEINTKKVYESGAKHYLKKSAYRSSLEPYIKNFLRFKHKDSWSKFFGQNFISQDKKLLESVRNLTSTYVRDQSIFLSGETGVGKTLLAKLIHQMTKKNTNFVHLNCSEIPADLIESELFGYHKGAFTGADKAKKGLLEQADKGTLFLDEIATMPIYTQQKLLKAIDEKTFYPLGSSSPIRVEFNLISATCEDLKDLIDKKKFREDLFFRLSGYEISIPPLRERPEDISLQIIHYLEQSEKKFFLEPAALEVLKNFSWPGNSRQLSKTIQSFSLGTAGIISKDHPIIQKLVHDRSDIPNFLNQKQIDLIYQVGLKQFISQAEVFILNHCLNKNEHKTTKTISDLKISNSHFYRIVKDSSQ